MENPKVQETKTKYENCQVCGRSFKKGRGLNIHMSATTCRAIFERQKKRNKNKSESSTIQESNHSGSTAETHDLHQSPANKEEKRSETNEAMIKDVLVIDDETEEKIKKEVLTLPQCIERKVQDIRQNGVKTGEIRNIVILKDKPVKPIKKVDKQKKARDNRQSNFKPIDIRKFMNKQIIKVETMVFENSSHKTTSKSDIKKEEVVREKPNIPDLSHAYTRKVKVEKSDKNEGFRDQREVQ